MARHAGTAKESTFLMHGTMPRPFSDHVLHSATTIDNIFSNVFTVDTISGKILIQISDDKLFNKFRKQSDDATKALYQNFQKSCCCNIERK